MTWNTKAGKSEIPLSRDTRDRAFYLPGKPLEKVQEVSYLGVSPSLLRSYGHQDGGTNKQGKNCCITTKSNRSVNQRH